MATKWFRLKPDFDKSSLSKVDRENRVIYDVSVCTAGEAKGHGVQLDEEFIADTVKFGNSWKTGVKSRFGHPSMSAEALGSAVGRFKNFRQVENQAKADIYFYKDVKGADNNIEYIMDLAEEDPNSFATSIVFEYGKEYKRDKNGEKIYDNNKSYDNIEGMPYLEIKKLLAVDFVDQPAANPNGLYSENDLSAIAYKFLEDNPEVLKVLQNNPDKLFDYIKTYNELKGDNNMDSAELNAEYEQLKLDSQRTTDELKLQIENKDKIIKELKSQIDKVNLSARDAIIKSYTDKLPEIKENRENVKAKLELMAEKIGTGAEFSEYAEMLLSKEDTRVKVENPSFEFSKKETQKDMTIQEFAEWQFNLQYGKKGE